MWHGKGDDLTPLGIFDRDMGILNDEGCRACSIRRLMTDRKGGVYVLDSPRESSSRVVSIRRKVTPVGP